MCGISGYFILPRSRSSDQMTAEVTRMTDAIIRRGPDDSGAWVDADAGIALGHRGSPFWIFRPSDTSP